MHYNHRYCNTLKKARIYALTNLYEEINTDFDINYTLPFYLLRTIETTKTLHIYLMTLKVAFHCNAYNNRTLLGTRGLVNIQYLNYCWEQQRGLVNVQYPYYCWEQQRGLVNVQYPNYCNIVRCISLAVLCGIIQCNSDVTIATKYPTEPSCCIYLG